MPTIKSVSKALLSPLPIPLSYISRDKQFDSVEDNLWPMIRYEVVAVCGEVGGIRIGRR